MLKILLNKVEVSKFEMVFMQSLVTIFLFVTKYIINRLITKPMIKIYQVVLLGK